MSSKIYFPFNYAVHKILSCNISIQERTYALSTLLHDNILPFSAKATP